MKTRNNKGDHQSYNKRETRSGEQQITSMTFAGNSPGFYESASVSLGARYPAEEVPGGRYPLPPLRVYTRCPAGTDQEASRRDSAQRETAKQPRLMVRGSSGHPHRPDGIIGETQRARRESLSFVPPDRRTEQGSLSNASFRGDRRAILTSCTPQE